MFLAVIVMAGLSMAAAGQTSQAPRPQPPEVQEIDAASRIVDAAARLKEFARIKTVYPQSAQMGRIDGFIQEAKIDLAGTVEEVVRLQKSGLGQGQGTRRLTGPLDAAIRLVEHPKIAEFDKAKVLAAVLAYKAEAAKAAAQPETFPATPNPLDRKEIADSYLRAFDLPVARAQALAGDGIKALSILDHYKVARGESNASYFSARGDALAAVRLDEDAFGAYLSAAIESYPGAEDKARAMYEKIFGTTRGFDSRLEDLRKALPFTPAPYKPSSSWKGKAVLAEVFTNSENPTCLGTDLAAAGLVQAYPAKYLAILEFHVPGQGPDPMMNPATKTRQDYYGLRMIPAVVIDGEVIVGGGGIRRASADKFKQYKSLIDPRINNAPGVDLSAEASRTGDQIKVAFKVKKTQTGAEVFAALVQGKMTYKGASGTIVHKLVVRDVVGIYPAASGKLAFDLAASNRAAEAYHAQSGSRFAQGPPAIDRDDLQVVVFVQDKETKRVLNAVVADVR